MHPDRRSAFLVQVICHRPHIYPLQEALTPYTNNLLLDTNPSAIDRPCDLEGEYPITRRGAEPEHVRQGTADRLSRLFDACRHCGDPASRLQP